MVFTSNGKASKGAQEVFELLPHQWVAPSELKNLPPNNGLVYGSVVSTEHMAKHVLVQLIVHYYVSRLIH